MERKNLNCTFEVKELKNEDPDYFYFKGYASTFGNTDLGADIVEKGAFLESLSERMPKMLWQHDRDEPVGIYTDAKEKEKGLYVEGKMPKADDLVRGRIIPQMKIGSITSMSIGFSIDIEEYDNKTGIRLIKKATLWEVSLVTLPMNEEAVITSMKKIEADKIQKQKEIKELKEKEFKKEKIEAIEKEIVFPLKEDGSIDFNYKWNKKDAIERIEDLSIYNNELDVSTKMSVLDVIDGELKTIPKALYSAAIELRTSNLESEEKTLISEELDVYFKAMGKENPLKKSFSSYIDDMNVVSELSDFFKQWGLSNKETNSLISALKRITRNEEASRDDEANAELAKSLDNFNKNIKEIL